LHLFALAARRVNLDCSRAASVAALLAAVRERARDLPRGAWLRGEGLDEARLGRLPTAAELDEAVPGRPVRLRHRSRDASAVSTPALRRLDAGTGPDGLVAGREDRLARLVGPLDPVAMRDALGATACELAAVGLTAVADATPRGPRALAPLRAAMADGR